MALIGLAGAACSPWLMPFPSGVAGAVLHLKAGHPIRLRVSLAVMMIGVAAVLWSWANHMASRSRFLLGISFPLYLTHLPVMLSFTSRAYILLQPSRLSASIYR